VWGFPDGQLADAVAARAGHGSGWKWFCQIIGNTYILGSCTIYLTTCKVALSQVRQHKGHDGPMPCTQHPPSPRTLPAGLPAPSPSRHRLHQVFQKCTDTKSIAGCDDMGCTKLGITNLSATSWLLIAAAILFPLIHIRYPRAQGPRALLVAAASGKERVGPNKRGGRMAERAHVGGGMGRSLSDAGIVSYVGVTTIAVVNTIIIVHSLQEVSGAGDHASTRLYPHNLMDFVNGMTALTFAYGGHVLMVDIQSVMKQPREWPKAVWTSQLFMFLNYAIVGYAPSQSRQRPSPFCNPVAGMAAATGSLAMPSTAAA
jgi:hypothetical protein